MTTLRISITKEVLEATKDCNVNAGRNCAIANAIRQIWPHGHVCTGYIHPFAHNHKCSIGVTLIRIVHGQHDFITIFDRATPAERAAMPPFSFEIEVPDEVVGEVNIEEIRDIIKNSKTLELV